MKDYKPMILALALNRKGPLTFLDRDVEESDALFFLRPKISHREPMCLPVPKILIGRCAAILNKEERQE